MNTITVTTAIITYVDTSLYSLTSTGQNIIEKTVKTACRLGLEVISEHEFHVFDAASRFSFSMKGGGGSAKLSVMHIPRTRVSKCFEDFVVLKFNHGRLH